MRRLSILAMMVAALLLVAGPASAQSKPNFGGTWTLVPDPNAPPPGGAGGGAGGGGGGGGRGGRGGGRGAISGPSVKITQDGATLKVERTAGQNTVTYNYTIGGEGKNTVTMGQNPMDVNYKTAWDGDKLVITSNQTMDMGGQSMTMSSKQVLSLAADGTMVVESTSSPMGGGDPVTTKATYKKG
jgi:hypothetical protein